MFNEPQMTDLPAEKQAAKAIAHTLRNISERAPVAWYLGHGTQTYALLTEAHATLRGITMEEAQDNWPPAEQRTFEGDSLNDCPFCGSYYLELKTIEHHCMVVCGDCQAKGPASDYCFDENEEAAASILVRDKWNKRSMPR